MKDEEIEPIKNNNPNYGNAENAAELDMKQDPDLDPTPDVANDLDEGELARFDNDGEKSYDTNENSDVFKNAVDSYSKPTTGI